MYCADCPHLYVRLTGSGGDNLDMESQAYCTHWDVELNADYGCAHVYRLDVCRREGRPPPDSGA